MYVQKSYISDVYRSRDQFFHTDGAVTYVFRRVKPSHVPTDMICCEKVELDGDVYYTNKYIVDAITKMR